MKPTSEQKQPAKEQYIEPIGFKGTTGEWDLGYGNASKSYGIFTKNMLDGGLFESPVCLVSPIDKLDETDKANAKLISQSKELAKALQDMIEEAKGAIFMFGNENNYPEGTGGYRIRKRLEGASENAKQVLKEAGLTDK